jgi:hypothetical protein
VGEGTVLVPLRSETYRFGEGEREPFRTESRRDRGERGRPFLVRRHPLPPETATYEFSCVGAGNVFVGGNGQGTPGNGVLPGGTRLCPSRSVRKKYLLLGVGFLGCAVVLTSLEWEPETILHLATGFVLGLLVWGVASLAAKDK